MLAHGEARLAAMPNLQGRVQFVEGMLPGARLPLPRYDAIISNSLLHHLHEPQGSGDRSWPRVRRVRPCS